MLQEQYMLMRFENKQEKLLTASFSLCAAMATAWIGLVVDPPTADAICAGDREVIPMSFQCRSLPKDTSFFLLQRDSKKAGSIREFIFAPGSGSTAPVVQLRAEIKFKGNRRIMEDKFQSQGRGLPTRTGDVLAMRNSLGLDPKKPWPIWEVKLVRVLEHHETKSLKAIPTGKNTTLTGQDLRQVFSSFYAFVIFCFVLVLRYIIASFSYFT